MFSILQNNEKFYLNRLLESLYNYSSQMFQVLKKTKYEAVKRNSFIREKGGLSQRASVWLM